MGYLNNLLYDCYLCYLNTLGYDLGYLNLIVYDRPFVFGGIFGTNPRPFWKLNKPPG